MSYSGNVVKTNPNGAVGSRAIVPRIAEQIVKKESFVLDYGCGTTERHVEQLKGKGFEKIFGYDLSLPRTLINRLRKYDVILLSNVLNVQPTEEAIRFLIAELKTMLKKTGFIIANYPDTPRKAGLSQLKLLGIIEKVFDTEKVDSELCGANYVLLLRRRD